MQDKDFSYSYLRPRHIIYRALGKYLAETVIIVLTLRYVDSHCGKAKS